MTTIRKERKRLEDLLIRAEVPEQKRAALDAVLDNMALLRVKLDEAGKDLRAAPIICEYSNGGGQSGTRINPTVKGFLDLWKAYLAGLQQFSSYLPKDLVEAATGAQDVLSIVRSMRA